MASVDGYRMTMVIKKIKTDEDSTWSYRLDDNNNKIDPIIEGWEAAGYIVLSVNFVRGGH